MALTVVPVTAEELIMGESVVQSDKDKDGCCKAEKACAVNTCCEPLWTFRAGLLVMKQESPSLYQDFDFDYEAGIDVSVMRRLGECRALEIRYMGVDDWSDRLEGEIPVGNIGDFQVGDIPVGATYSSALHSTEINLRRQWSDRITTLAGFRWVEVDEELGLDVFDYPILGSDADNHMYGFQLGGELLIWDRGGPLQVTSGAKAGVYYNRSDVTFSLDIPSPPAPFPISGSETFKDSHTSFLGEWDVTAKVALTENIAVRASYELMWIEGSTRAEGQIRSLYNTGELDTSGSQFYHGGIIGIELTR
jgi:hypothetical protein